MGWRGYNCKCKGPGRPPKDSLEPRLEGGFDDGHTFWAERKQVQKPKGSSVSGMLEEHPGRPCDQRGGNHQKTIGLSQFLPVSRNSKLACYPPPLTPCAPRPSVTQRPGPAPPLREPQLIVKLGHWTQSDECDLNG